MADPAKILVIEDDRALLAGIVDLLEVSDIGYDIEVLTASDGRGGLDVLGEQTPDLIISDIMMPGMGGYEFLHQVRKNSDWIYIPVIFLSAKGTPNDIREGRLSGAELYITKPYDSEELLQLIESQLDRTFQLQQDREQRLQHLRSNIVQVLNHEFRTPLTYVTAYYDLLADGLFSDDLDILQEYLSGIQVGARRLRNLVDDLITVMELRTGELAARYKRQGGLIHDLGDLLNSLCARYSHELKDQNVHFEYHLSSPLPVIFGHRELLLDACDRLIDNAVKFCLQQEDEAMVIVRAEGEDNQVRISVEDNGVGLPDTAYNQIFDLFYQHNRPVLEQQGAGTGLTIAQGFVELHNGRIEVASVVGKGSAFTIVLPAVTAEQERDFNEFLISPGKRHASILIVEDEAHLLEGLRDLLDLFDGAYELNILTASSGREALNILNRQPVDLIISDIMMPGMDGYELLQTIRNTQSWVHLPVIFLTARSEKQDILRGRRSGVEEYITKPYDGQELFDLVVVQLDRHFERQALLRHDFEELKRGILNVLLPGLRIPLEAVNEYSQRLGDELGEVSTLEGLLDHLLGIQAGSNQLTRLAEDFIFLAELQTGEATKLFRLNAKPANVSLLLDDLSRSVYRDTEGEEIKFKREFDFTLPEVMVERQILWKSLDRLIEIATKNSDGTNLQSGKIGEIASGISGQEIILRTSLMGDFVCLSLGTGRWYPGIEEIERINDLLNRPELVVLELSEHNPGLMIVKGCVDIHGGQIIIEQSSKGGYNFNILLPVVDTGVGNKDN